MADQRDILLVENREFLTSSDSKLPFDQILSRDHFSNWMFHLQSSVHLHKVELIVSSIEYKLDSTCVDISNSSGSLYSCLTYLRAYLLRYLRWSLLDDLLMTSLHRAVTLIQVDIVAMSVTEDL